MHQATAGHQRGGKAVDDHEIPAVTHRVGPAVAERQFHDHPRITRTQRTEGGQHQASKAGRQVDAHASHRLCAIDRQRLFRLAQVLERGARGSQLDLAILGDVYGARGALEQQGCQVFFQPLDRLAHAQFIGAKPLGGQRKAACLRHGDERRDVLQRGAGDFLHDGSGGDKGSQSATLVGQDVIEQHQAPEYGAANDPRVIGRSEVIVAIATGIVATGVDFFLCNRVEQQQGSQDDQ